MAERGGLTQQVCWAGRGGRPQWTAGSRHHAEHEAALGRLHTLVKQLSGYYLSVVELLQRRYGLNTSVLDAGATAGGRHGDANIEAARRVAHQSFIYLGDLCTLLAASRLQGHPG